MGSSIHQSLTRALTGANTRALTLDVDTPHRYVIFSDQHKGAGDQADEFEVCRATYRAALFHYLEAGHTLILLGDIEELWENSFREVFAQHGELIDLEAAFGPERYFRIWGNHDDGWSIRRRVEQYLSGRIPEAAQLAEALRFEVRRGADAIGTMVVLHGHQGTFDSDRLAWLARPVLRHIWRPIAQNFFGVGRQSPSADARLRGAHDRTMYEWAAGQRRLMLVAGHTHRPVWAARTHLQTLVRELAELEDNPRAGDAAWEEAVAERRRTIERKRAESPPEFDMVDDQLRPCYFNTGCCKFSDGDITGIEIVNGTLSLVKWSAPRGEVPPGRVALESGSLAGFFGDL